MRSTPALLRSMIEWPLVRRPMRTSRPGVIVNLHSFIDGDCQPAAWKTQ